MATTGVWGHWVCSPLALWAEKGTRGALNSERAMLAVALLNLLPCFLSSYPPAFPHQLPFFCLLFPTL